MNPDIDAILAAMKQANPVSVLWDPFNIGSVISSSATAAGNAGGAVGSAIKDSYDRTMAAIGGAADAANKALDWTPYVLGGMALIAVLVIMQGRQYVPKRVSISR